MQHGIASDTNFKNYLTEVYAVYLYSSWEGLWKSYKAMVKNPVTLSGMGSTDHKKKKKSLHVTIFIMLSAVVWHLLLPYVVVFHHLE